MHGLTSCDALFRLPPLNHTTYGNCATTHALFSSHHGSGLLNGEAPWIRSVSLTCTTPLHALALEPSAISNDADKGTCDAYAQA